MTRPRARWALPAAVLLLTAPALCAQEPPVPAAEPPVAHPPSGVLAPPGAAGPRPAADEPPPAPLRPPKPKWSLDPGGAHVNRPDGTIDYFYTPRYRSAERVRAELVGAVKFAADGEAVLLKDFNLLILRGTPERVADLRRFLHRYVDTPPAQVLLEAMIAEVQYTRDFQFGFEAAFSQAHERTFFRGFGLTYNPEAVLSQQLRQGGGAVLAPITGLQGDFQTLDNTIVEDGKVGRALGGDRTANNEPASLRALYLANRVEIRSRPRVLVQEGMTAELEAGDSVPVQKIQLQPGGAVSITPEYQPVTTKLRVTAHSIGANAAHLEFTAEYAEIVDFTDPNVTGGIAQPIIVRRALHSETALRDGQTLIIGGLYSESTVVRTTGIPLLADLPVVGQLFKAHKREQVKTELVFFLTPTILRERTAEQRLGE